MDIFKAWEKVIGGENVLTDEKTLSAVQTATFSTNQQVLAVIRPGTRQEIQECVRIANQYKTPIYPVSGGKNWGLGSRVPIQDHCVVMELGRLNHIIDYNEKLAYITVEPGVSFRQAYQYLQENHSNLFLSVIGGSPEASIIGNTLERGDGSGTYGDRVGYVCGFEVVLPTGELIHTGMGRFPNAKTTAVDRWGVGLHLDGLFVQSNLGIVTQMTLWLMPIPQYFQSFYCIPKDYSQLENVIDAVQKLMLYEIIPDSCFSFWNSYKLLATKGKYPWKITKNKTPLILKELKGNEPWLGSGQLYSGSKEQGLATRKIIEGELESLVDKITFVEVDKDNPDATKNSSLGVPTEEKIKSAYWRKKTPIPPQIDPDRDNCGVLWLCPLFPFEGNPIIEMIEIIESTIQAYQFEPNIAISCTSPRTLRMFIAIIYDREIVGEDSKAMECHDRLLKLLTKAGYIPYRLGLQSMNSLPQAQDDYGKLISTLKQSLDPNNILAPGRYDFRQDWLKN